MKIDVKVFDVIHKTDEQFSTGRITYYYLAAIKSDQIEVIKEVSYKEKITTITYIFNVEVGTIIHFPDKKKYKISNINPKENMIEIDTELS